MNEGNSTEGSDQGDDDDDEVLDDMAGPEQMLVSPPKSSLNKKVQDVVGLTLGGTWAMEGRARSLGGITALALASDRWQEGNANERERRAPQTTTQHNEQQWACEEEEGV